MHFKRVRFVKGSQRRKLNQAKIKPAKYFTNENFPIYGITSSSAFWWIWAKPFVVAIRQINCHHKYIMLAEWEVFSRNAAVRNYASIQCFVCTGYAHARWKSRFLEFKHKLLISQLRRDALILKFDNYNANWQNIKLCHSTCHVGKFASACKVRSLFHTQ